MAAKARLLSRREFAKLLDDRVQELTGLDIEEFIEKVEKGEIERTPLVVELAMLVGARLP